ncbi:MAG: DUF3098 domain-containing protein [Ekhidna sp.]|nr:DUF3098 domain-containing protein [Ekhidna sp.]
MSEKRKLAFGKMNYIVMITGVIVLIIGFIFMTMDNEPYGFGSMGLTVGPVTVMLGFLIQFVALFYKSEKESKSE